ncbi:hypothetical protein [Mycobacterium sp. 236(2023)]|uniref:hypothetical protein n=1 Tax=Mycobacterium sp. 236(2023) TaxID=3038163 RepID=UPI0024153E00|nr:hypothetical protein [Mycobacterium sp. 236(2023)]MDG4665211.1 hypothetical protein [Mycobacterium sp. 236(2023)]
MSGPARAIVLALLLAGFGVFSSVWTVNWLVRGSYVTAALIGLLTIWAFGYAAYFVITALGAPNPRTDSGAHGVLLRPGIALDVVNFVPAAAISLAAALYLIFSRFDMIDYTPAGIQRVTVPAGCVALLLFSAPTMYRRFKYKGGGHLRLDPAGFEVWNGQWGSLKHGAWDEVEEILDHPIKGKAFNRVIVFVLADGSSATLMADTIISDFEPLYEWVRFYWEHPEYRGELVDDRAFQRLRGGNFTTG